MDGKAFVLSISENQAPFFHHIQHHQQFSHMQLRQSQAVPEKHLRPPPASPLAQASIDLCKVLPARQKLLPFSITETLSPTELFIQALLPQEGGKIGIRWPTFPNQNTQLLFSTEFPGIQRNRQIHLVPNPIREIFRCGAKLHTTHHGIFFSKRQPQMFSAANRCDFF